MKCLYLYLLFTCTAIGQVHDFRKDSLQIKAYSTIIYKDSEPQKVRVAKVFCEYCNEAQNTFIKLKAWQSAYRQRRYEDNIIENGEVQIALYIRVSKEYFRNLGKNEE